MSEGGTTGSEDQPVLSPRSPSMTSAAGSKGSLASLRILVPSGRTIAATRLSNGDGNTTGSEEGELTPSRSSPVSLADTEAVVAFYHPVGRSVSDPGSPETSPRRRALLSSARGLETLVVPQRPQPPTGVRSAPEAPTPRCERLTFLRELPLPPTPSTMSASTPATSVSSAPSSLGSGSGGGRLVAGTRRLSDDRSSVSVMAAAAAWAAGAQTPMGSSFRLVNLPPNIPGAAPLHNLSAVSESGDDVSSIGNASNRSLREEGRKTPPILRFKKSQERIKTLLGLEHFQALENHAHLAATRKDGKVELPFRAPHDMVFHKSVSCTIAPLPPPKPPKVTPGPGDYIEDIEKLNEMYRQGSSRGQRFRQSIRITDPAIPSQAPPPGAYDPVYPEAVGAARVPGRALRTAPRFPPIKSDSPGPGCYDVQGSLSHLEVSPAPTISSLPYPSFLDQAVRELSQGPPVGSYEVAVSTLSDKTVTTLRSRTDLGARMKTKRPSRVRETPGPQTYYPKPITKGPKGIRIQHRYVTG